MITQCIRLAVLVFICCVAAQAQCASGSLIVVINKSNATESLSTAQLRKLLLGDVRAWPDRKPVMFVARDFNSKTFECSLNLIVRQSVAEYRRYVMNAEFRGEEPMALRTADSAAAAAKIVASSPGAIAIVESSALPSIGNDVKVVKVNGKAPGDSGYPL